jgi:DNA-binding MarR family transcriptional regulator
MSKRSTPRHPRSRQARPARAAQWEEFADLVLVIAREIQFRGYHHPEALPLTQSEGSVMRYLFGNPGALPSQVALGTGLQRSNLSAVLRGLEKKELVEGVDDPDDARSVHLHPTARAISNYKLVRREWADAVKAAADGEGEVDSTLPLLRKIAAGLIHQRQAASER